jgi:hypothetical protein
MQSYVQRRKRRGRHIDCCVLMRAKRATEYCLQFGGFSVNKTELAGF